MRKYNSEGVSELPKAILHLASGGTAPHYTMLLPECLEHYYTFILFFSPSLSKPVVNKETELLDVTAFLLGRDSERIQRSKLCICWMVVNARKEN